MVEDVFRRGLASHQRGDLTKAERAYHDVLRQQPNHVDALHLLGVIMAMTRRNERAIELIKMAVALKPDFPEALNNLGSALAELGRLEEALPYYAQMIALKSDHAEAYFNRGNALRGLKRFAEAVTDYDQAIALDPISTEAHINRGNALRELGHLEAALSGYDTAIALAPDHAEAHFNRGNALADLGRSKAALSSYDRAIALDQGHVAAYFNRGVVLRDLGRSEAALSSYDRAIALQPDFVAAHDNRGGALVDLGRYEEALSAFNQAIELNPDAAEAYSNQSLCHLAMGDFERGWEMFEWRWYSGHARPRLQLPGLPWLGDAPLAGKTILVHAEQGFGDTLQFCRYVPILAEQATVVLEVPRPLLRLLSGLKGESQIVAAGEALPRFDIWIPMMSLPLAFRTTVSTIPAAVPYLYADPERCAFWRQRLAALPGRKIGLVWAGSTRPGRPRAEAMDRRRSMTLEHFAPLASVPGLCFISLQKGEPAAQAGMPPAGLTLHDWTHELDDFADTASLIEGLDLVISVDTAVVHLAGALGKKVWVLNRYDLCWRWLRGRVDNPWYPTARLFNQQTPGDWSGVIRDVTEALREPFA